MKITVNPVEKVMEQENAPRESPIYIKRRLRYFGILIVIITLITLIAGVTLLVDYLTGNLREFILNVLEINEFYVGKVIGIFFLLCSSALLVLVLILDGEDRKISTALTKYVSKLIVEDYYGDGKKEEEEAVSEGTQPAYPSARAAASVRPKAVALEEDYKEGRLDGAFKEFFPNGNVKREVRYMNGKLNGLFRTYYENGQIEQEAVYQDGQIEGMYRSFYEGGDLHQEKSYIHGKLNGVYRAIDEHEIPFFEISYKDDIQHGPDKIYDQKGVLQYLDTYQEGILINRKTYDEYGLLKYDQDFEENIEEAQKRAGEEAQKRAGEEAVKEREEKEKENRRQKKDKHDSRP